MSPGRDVGTVVQRDLGVLTWWCAALPATAHLEVLCVESPSLPGPPDRQVVRLTGCLADAGAADLAEVAAASGSLVLRVDGCAHGVAGPAVRQVAGVLAALGATDRLEVWTRLPDGGGLVPERPEHGVRALPARRRALFGWALPTRSAVQPAVDRPAHRRLVDALRSVLDGAPVGAAASALPSDALDLRSSGCTACGTCVKACPTDVLTLRKASAEGAVLLTLDQAGCIGCADCVTLCPVDALHSAGPVDWGRLLEGPVEVVLEEMVTRTCRRCCTDFASGPADSDLCPVCTDRRANPFGSTLPPGYVPPHVDHPPGTGGP